MREFITSPDGRRVDLDDHEIYSYLPDDIDRLDDKMEMLIGRTILYMNYYPDRGTELFPLVKQEPDMVESGYGLVDVNNCGWYQRVRVEKLIKQYAEGKRDAVISKNTMWFKEQIFLFQNEIENMC